MKQITSVDLINDEILSLQLEGGSSKLILRLWDHMVSCATEEYKFNTNLKTEEYATQNIRHL